MMDVIALEDKVRLPTPTALALLSPTLAPGLRRITNELGMNLVVSSATDIAVARIEAGCPEIVLVETDLVGRVEDVFTFARSLRPDVWLIAVTCYWSERDERVREFVNAVVHKPARGEEWRRAVLAAGLSKAETVRQLTA